MQSKSILGNILILLVFCSGLGLLLYPAFSDCWNSFHQSQVLVNYENTVEKMSKSLYKKIIEEAKAYNKNLAEEGIDWHMSKKQEQKYNEILNINESGIMGYVEIPSIQCSLPIYHGTEEAVLQVAVGHLQGSSLPVGGKGSHCIISGHRGLPSAKLFTDLDQMKEGDNFSIHVMKEQLFYEVDQIQVVLPEETESLQIEKDADLCTLVTCTPYGINSHRLLVMGRRIDTPQTEEIAADEKGEEKMQPWYLKSGFLRWFLLGIVLCFCCLKIHVEAITQVDTTAQAGLKIQYEVENAVFSLYKVADVSKTYRFTSTKEFAAFHKKEDTKTAKDWRTQAESLADYVKENQISPYVKTKISNEGTLIWDNLPVGLYLVIGDKVSDGTKQYIPSPFLVSLPSQNEEKEWEYCPTVYPKYKVTTESEISDMSDILPQTGQLWWPVPILIGIGLLFFVFMWHYRRKL